MDIHLGPIPEGTFGYEDKAAEGATRDRRRRPRPHPEQAAQTPSYEEVAEQREDYYEPADPEDVL